MVLDLTERKKQAYNDQIAFAEELSDLVQDVLGENFSAHPERMLDVKVSDTTTATYAFIPRAGYKILIEGGRPDENDTGFVLGGLMTPEILKSLLEFEAIKVEKSHYSAALTTGREDTQISKMSDTTYTFLCHERNHEDALAVAQALHERYPDAKVVVDYKPK